MDINVTVEQEKSINITVEHGLQGDSAYIIAVRNGFEGTEQEWVLSEQADFIEADNTKRSYVKNKPNIPTQYTDDLARTAVSSVGYLVANDITNKVDKETGKGLSTNDYTTSEKTKLSGIETGANNYTHPLSHSPSIITQDESNRFVTDTEKSTWNGKQNSLPSQTDKTGKFLQTNGSDISWQDVPAGYTDDMARSAVSSVGYLVANDIANKVDTTDARLSDARTPTSHTHTGVYEPANSNIQSHISDKNNPHEVDKTDVGLGNCDNTSDANKPVSTAQAIAIGLKQNSLTSAQLSAIQMYAINNF